uniref:B-cell receptor CD22-like n=1 Tax=Oncorhynchus gorbuscha TaxID=8017 RepID=UPI001EAEF44E|nr:B-cell receptor CD22-like [Oncorhynchus gorbuscha]
MFAGLLLFIPVLLAEDVAVLFCRKKSVCVLEGLSVKLSCGFTIQDTRRKLKEFYWFNNNNRKKWKDTTIPEELSEDPEYYGRLLHGAVGGFSQYSLTTTIINLRPSDSAEYKFRLNTQNSGWKNSESGTTVFVTGLKVIKNSDTVKEGQKVTLTCSTMCILSNNPNLTYIWYKNGRRLTNPKTLKTSLYLDPFSITDSGSYSCAVNDLCSPSLCLLDNCWDVKYAKKTICAITGSSVDLPCTYTYPSGQTITQTLWSKTVDAKGKPEALEYGDSVQYRGDKKTDCTLRITELTERDSANYSFRFKTQHGSYNDPFQVTLSVTDVFVKVSPDIVIEGEKVWISCSTSCILKQNSTDYIFYKDKLRLPSPNRHWVLYLDPVSSEDAGSYSCVLVGLENQPSLGATLTVRYPPRSTTVTVSTDQNKIVEGSSVTLTCSSDANPPMEKYTWYKRNGTKVSVLHGETDSYTIPSVSLGYINQYFCEAKNEIGAQNSTWDLTTDDRLVNVLTPVLCIVAVLTAGTLLVLSYYTLKQRNRGERADTPRVHYVSNDASNSAVSEEEGVDTLYAHPDDYDDIQRGIDEYDDIQDDTYSALQGDSRLSMYDYIPKRESP